MADASMSRASVAGRMSGRTVPSAMPRSTSARSRSRTGCSASAACGGVGLAHRHAGQEAHVPDRAPEPRAQQGDGGGGMGVVGRGGDGVQAFGADVDHGEHEGVAVREVAVEGAPGQARGGGDALERGVGCLAERVRRRRRAGLHGWRSRLDVALDGPRRCRT